MRKIIRKAMVWLTMAAMVFAMMGCGAAETSQSIQVAEVEEAAERNTSEQKAGVVAAADVIKDEAAEKENGEPGKDNEAVEAKTAVSGKEGEVAEETTVSEKDETMEQENLHIDDGHEMAADAVHNMINSY